MACIAAMWAAESASSCSVRRWTVVTKLRRIQLGPSSATVAIILVYGPAESMDEKTATLSSSACAGAYLTVKNSCTALAEPSLSASFAARLTALPGLLPRILKIAAVWSSLAASIAPVVRKAVGAASSVDSRAACAAAATPAVETALRKRTVSRSSCCCAMARSASIQFRTDSSPAASANAAASRVQVPCDDNWAKQALRPWPTAVGWSPSLNAFSAAAIRSSVAESVACCWVSWLRDASTSCCSSTASAAASALP